MKLKSPCKVFGNHLMTGLVLGIVLSGCAAKGRITPIDKTFLADVDVSQKIENLPFKHSWIRPGFDGSKYSKLYIKPVRVDQLPPDLWNRSASSVISSKTEYFEEAQQLAAFFHSELVKNINGYSDNRLQLLDAPVIGELSFEIALTELEFAHPTANAATFASPIPGTGAALSAISEPHVAFAGRLTDGQGQLAATIGDRKYPPTRIVDLNKFTVTSSAREICSNWAAMIAETFNKGPMVEIENRGTFSIKPW